MTHRAPLIYRWTDGRIWRYSSERTPVWPVSCLPLAITRTAPYYGPRPVTTCLELTAAAWEWPGRRDGKGSDLTDVWGRAWRDDASCDGFIRKRTDIGYAYIHPERIHGILLQRIRANIAWVVDCEWRHMTKRAFMTCGVCMLQNHWCDSSWCFQLRDVPGQTDRV